MRLLVSLLRGELSLAPSQNLGASVFVNPTSDDRPFTRSYAGEQSAVGFSRQGNSY